MEGDDLVISRTMRGLCAEAWPLTSRPQVLTDDQEEQIANPQHVRFKVTPPWTPSVTVQVRQLSAQA